MIAFQTYLDTLKQTFNAAGDHRSSLFATKNVAEPTDTELMNFLATLLGIVGTETKKSGVAKAPLQVGIRNNAIALLMDFATTAPIDGAFSHISRNQVCFELALRVRRPKIIDQQDTTLCGPVAIVVDVAKRDPERYVRTLTELFRNGRAAWGNSVLEPGLLVRRGYNKLTPQADYLILASMRDTWAIMLEDKTIRNILTLTKPGALCTFLSNAGYTDVLDRSFLLMSTSLKALDALTPHKLHGESHLPGDQGIKSLRQAAAELAGGRTVIMNAAGTLSHIIGHDASKKVAAPGPIDAGETHWTLLRQLTINGPTVFVRMVTWGGARERTISTNVFLSYYCGYVSGNPI
jgi:hypothetical protein